MPPLRQDLRRSARLQVKPRIAMLPSGGGRGYPQYSFVPQPDLRMATSKPRTRTTAAPPMEPTSHPPTVRSQAKQARKHHQEPQEGSGSEAIHWEPYPQLTRDLLSWILRHPADHAVLFNETMDQNIQGKPHSRRKKDINAIIADAIFHQDRQYGESYASHPAKFALAVASRLVILKNKYQQHASRFKSTGEGVNPNNPNYWNLHEQVLTEFPFWEECDQLWHGNPTYDARVFNATPGANRTGDFLTIIKSGGTTAPPTCDRTQDQDQDDAVEYPGSSANADWEPDPNIPMDAFEQEEEEEEGEIGEGWEGEWNVVSVPECRDDFMPVDEQPQTLGNHLPSQQESGNSTNMVLPPDKPPSAMHRHTASSDSRSAFHAAPYPRPPASTISTMTTSSSPSSSTRRAGTVSESSQTSLTKGKNVLAQMKADLDGRLTGLNEASQDQRLLRATLKYEHKVAKTQAYMREKEIAHLETEHERERNEAEKAHIRILEQKKLDLEMLKEELELMRLRLELARLQNQQVGDVSVPSISTTAPPTTQSTSRAPQSDGL
ncbi:hypothetical protein EDC04DRAFT_2887356 [Pisolithus marmoratus]|nr:hypothetical protein EDC04DRAFT_2887356 [Pisolithus marmoratus]